MKALRCTSSFGFRLFLAALVSISISAAFAQRVDQLPRPTDYVSDFANVLSADTVAQLDRICVELDHSAANTQLAIVTVHNLDGEDPADYANQLEDKWKMGKKESDRGALLLLAIDDHKWRIDVGYGLEGILNDAKVGDIGRSMVPYLRAGDYDSAVKLAVGQIARVIAADAKVTLDEAPAAPRPPPTSHAAAGLARLLPFLILIFLFGGFGLLRFLFGLGMLSSGLGGRRYYGGGPFISGGGWGGGGSGDSGGGGFGGFGGGGFGGGGAGGDW